MNWLARSAPVMAYRYFPQQAEPMPRVADYRSELLSAVDELPPLPLVLNRVIALLNDNNASSAQIAAMIEKDTVLAGSVLRCVNSAYYGLTSQVTSIRHAVSMLGFSTVRNLSLAFSLRRMLTGSRIPPPRLYSRYSQHSLSCAMLSQYLVRYVKVEDPDTAFAAGLFHDIGKLLILTTFPDLTPKLIEEYEHTEKTWEQCEQALLQITHPEVSRIVMEKWKLPASIQVAVEYHHRPLECPREADQTLTLAQILHAADTYVNEYGLEILPTKRASSNLADRAFEEIGLRQRMPEVLERFKAEYESIRSLF
jgi:putative nucleotidyltransferase with HDIG domain